MPALAQLLRRYPRLFDRLNRLNRAWFRQPPLYREISRHLPAGTPFRFLQIGANDGISHDPFREFMIRREARGLAAEPVPDFFRQMRRHYASYRGVTPVKCAVGYPAGHLPFYTFRSEYLARHKDAAELAGLAGFSRDKLAARLAPGEDAKNCIEEIVIPVRTVEELMEEHGFEALDCLFMDCEGHEQNILLNLDYERVRPRLIIFEHSHFGERAVEIESHLARHGFDFTRLQHDTLAVREP